MKKITIICMLLLSAVTMSQDGQLDLSFANNGIYNPTNLNFEGSLLDLSVDAANNIYISGNVVNSDNTKSIIVLKLLPNGTLDTTFGNNGSARVHYNPWAFVSKNIVLENGKIVLVGRISSNTNDILIVKLNADGNLDSSFGINGRITIDSGFGDDRAFTVTEYNNSLIIGGYLWNQEGKSDFSVLKLNMDGSMDTSFGEGGISKLSIPSKKGEIRDLVISNEGDIFGCGKIRDPSKPYYNLDDFAIIKMDQNGLLDSSFGNNGFVIISSNNNEVAHSIKNFGNSFFVTGHKYDPDNAVNNVLVTKINTNGVLDSSFGNNGKLVFTPGGPYGFYYGGFSSILQNNNKLIIGGYRANINFGETIYSRINPNGSLDEEFGTNGSIHFDFLSSPEGSNRALAKQFDNKFLSLGISYQNPELIHHIFLSRHNIDQTLSVQGEEVNDTDYVIYPNPASEKLFIKRQAKELADGIIYDLTGKLILRFFLDAQETQLDVHNFAAGIYFLKISNNESSIVKKIVVE